MFNASEGGRLTQTFEFTYTADGVEQAMLITWKPEEYYHPEPRHPMQDDDGNEIKNAQGEVMIRGETYAEWLDRVVETKLFRNDAGEPITCVDAQKINPGNADIMRTLVAAVRTMSDPNRRRSLAMATG